MLPLKLLLIALITTFIMGCQSAHLIKSSDLGRLVEHNESFSLLNTQGEPTTIKDLAVGKKGSVLIFWQRSCPCVKRYQPRVNDLHARYGHALSFAHISSNTNESFGEVKKEYARRAIPLPLLRDEGGLLARALSAKGTPSAVLLNEKGAIVFMGWIDNERDSKEPGRKAYLEDAINELLSQKPIGRPSSPMFGCAIR